MKKSAFLSWPNFAVGFIAYVISFSGYADMIRVATFNSSLNRQKAGQLVENLAGGKDPQAQAVAQIIQHMRPDIVLLTEFDYDPQAQSIHLFQEQYLNVGQAGQEGVSYPYFFTAPVNTGVTAGVDLNRDGQTEGPQDTYGYGWFPGQYGMVLFSKFPIQVEAVRTFQFFLWKDMPSALLPDDPITDTPKDWYSADALARFRLSSKSHWDVPVMVGTVTLHILASHPTPPVFDEAEDRNGRRNHDEIRFWTDYITPDKSSYIYDDNKQFGGLDPDTLFVICGDLNTDPIDGNGRHEAIAELLGHPRIQDLQPASKGALEAAAQQGGVNLTHKGPAQLDTYQSRPGQSPGNLRLDYVLPSCSLRVIKTGVFWPDLSDPLAKLVAGPPHVSSDHRLVFADIEISAVKQVKGDEK